MRVVVRGVALAAGRRQVGPREALLVLVLVELGSVELGSVEQALRGSDPADEDRVELVGRRRGIPMELAARVVDPVEREAAPWTSRRRSLLERMPQLADRGARRRVDKQRMARRACARERPIEGALSRLIQFRTTP